MMITFNKTTTNNQLINILKHMTNFSTRDTADFGPLPTLSTITNIEKSLERTPSYGITNLISMREAMILSLRKLKVVRGRSIWTFFRS